jgi:hypothetical protein
MQADPAAFGFLLLPRLPDLDDIALLQLDAAKRGLGKLRLELLRRIGADPFAGLGTECCLLRGVIEIHGGPLLLRRVG